MPRTENDAGLNLDCTNSRRATEGLSYPATEGPFEEQERRGGSDHDEPEEQYDLRCMRKLHDEQLVREPAPPEDDAIVKDVYGVARMP